MPDITPAQTADALVYGYCPQTLADTKQADAEALGTPVFDVDIAINVLTNSGFGELAASVRQLDAQNDARSRQLARVSHERDQARAALDYATTGLDQATRQVISYLDLRDMYAAQGELQADPIDALIVPGGSWTPKPSESAAAIHLTAADLRVVVTTVALLGRERDQLRQQLDDAQTETRTAYRERAQLVALLAALYPSKWAYTDPEYPDWPVLYITLPTGQASWHYHPDDAGLIAHVPHDDTAEWDGHTTGEKYVRIRELTAALGAPRHGDAFRADLARELRDPEFRREFTAELARIEATQTPPTTWTHEGVTYDLTRPLVDCHGDAWEHTGWATTLDGTRFAPLLTEGDEQAISPRTLAPLNRVILQYGPLTQPDIDGMDQP